MAVTVSPITAPSGRVRVKLARKPPTHPLPTRRGAGARTRIPATVTPDAHALNKTTLTPWRDALYHGNRAGLTAVRDHVFDAAAQFHLCSPFETIDGADDYIRTVLDPLLAAIPDLERRDTIVIAGTCLEDGDWVGCCGYYTGTWHRPWLDIPATGKSVSLRFHEFYRFENHRVVEVQAIWDIPEMMMQSGCWPMGPPLGRLWHVPAPTTQDGLVHPVRDAALDDDSRQRVLAMLRDMGRHPGEPPEVMKLSAHWHPHCHWYGPAGVGTCRGIDGFRRHHQIPFLKSMPDRHGGYRGDGHFFAEQRYVGVTGWPNMAMTLTGSGWLGIAASGQTLTMRSLDFWRLEGELIRENWVLIDLLHIWDQIGVDVFERMRELTRH